MWNCISTNALNMTALDKIIFNLQEDEKPGPSGALKVTRITPHSERLSSPPTHHQRNGTLPPLGSERDVVPSPSQGRAQVRTWPGVCCMSSPAKPL